MQTASCMISTNNETSLSSQFFIFIDTFRTVLVFKFFPKLHQSVYSLHRLIKFNCIFNDKKKDRNFCQYSQNYKIYFLLQKSQLHLEFWMNLLLRCQYTDYCKSLD